MNEQGKSLTAQGRTALIKVAEWLERGAPHVVIKDGIEIGQFDMEYSVEPNTINEETGECGTACCIAGAVCQFEMLGERKYDGLSFFSDEFRGTVGAGQLAMDFLGITDEQHDELFLPWDCFDYDYMTEFSSPLRAAAVVRHFLATGEVRWDRFDEDGVDVDLDDTLA